VRASATEHDPIMTSHVDHDDDPFDALPLRWNRPILPDRGPTRSRVDSPITRRLLDDVGLTPGDRLLVVNGRDPQLIELAAESIGPCGAITWIEPDPDRRRRVARRFRRLADLTVVPDLDAAPSGRHDAIALVQRDRTTPDPQVVRMVAASLDPGGRLAVVAVGAPSARIAASGSLRHVRRARDVIADDAVVRHAHRDGGQPMSPACRTRAARKAVSSSGDVVLRGDRSPAIRS
jgi:hypothetical protein